MNKRISNIRFIQIDNLSLTSRNVHRAIKFFLMQYNEQGWMVLLLSSKKEEDDWLAAHYPIAQRNICAQIRQIWEDSDVIVFFARE